MMTEDAIAHRPKTPHGPDVNDEVSMSLMVPGLMGSMGNAIVARRGALCLQGLLLQGNEVEHGLASPTLRNFDLG